MRNACALLGRLLGGTIGAAFILFALAVAIAATIWPAVLIWKLVTL